MTTTTRPTASGSRCPTTPPSGSVPRCGPTRPGLPTTGRCRRARSPSRRAARPDGRGGGVHGGHPVAAALPRAARAVRDAADRVARRGPGPRRPPGAPEPRPASPPPRPPRPPSPPRCPPPPRASVRRPRVPGGAAAGRRPAPPVGSTPTPPRRPAALGRLALVLVLVAAVIGTVVVLQQRSQFGRTDAGPEEIPALEVAPAQVDLGTVGQPTALAPPSALLPGTNTATRGRRAGRPSRPGPTGSARRRTSRRSRSRPTGWRT